MQILILSGSRNREGQTARAINAIRKGISAAKGNSECLFLTEMKLERCRQCDPDGWGLCRKEGRCVIEDDFASIVKMVKAADLVVFANPVYFGDLSESMRGFLDRFRRTRFMRPGAAPPGPFPSAGGTPAIGLCYAGGSGNGTISCCANLERILQTCGFDVVDMIPARRQNLEVKLPMLELVGKWLATKPTSGPPFVPPGR
ncbi:MAG TPA: flavodoxin family protein [Dehalococcoidales bacterium]|nr:flavodoxin family protein [Dehalococcoidales bacterium]